MFVVGHSQGLLSATLLRVYDLNEATRRSHDPDDMVDALDALDGLDGLATTEHNVPLV